MNGSLRSALVVFTVCFCVVLGVGAGVAFAEEAPPPPAPPPPETVAATPPPPPPSTLKPDRAPVPQAPSRPVARPRVAPPPPPPPSQPAAPARAARTAVKPKPKAKAKAVAKPKRTVASTPLRLEPSAAVAPIPYVPVVEAQPDPSAGMSLRVAFLVLQIGTLAGLTFVVVKVVRLLRATRGGPGAEATIPTSPGA